MASGSDRWIIKKNLAKSDIRDSRLLLPASLVSNYILPNFSENNLAGISDGLEVGVWDCDTHTEHQVIFRNKSPYGYVFEGNWTTAFVNRRGLKQGNMIALDWDSSNSRFNFCVPNLL